MKYLESCHKLQIDPRHRVLNQRQVTLVRVIIKARHLKAFVAELSSIQILYVSRSGSYVSLYLASRSLPEYQNKLFDIDNLFCYQMGRHKDHLLDEE